MGSKNLNFGKGSIPLYCSFGRNQGIRIKGREMVLVWHEKARCTAVQTDSLLHTHTLLVQTHNMTTVKESAEKFRKIIFTLEKRVVYC